MRFVRLLLVVLTITALGRTAVTQESPSQNTKTQASASSDFVRPFSASKDEQNLLHWPQKLAPPRKYSLSDTPDFAMGNTCLMMRTLVVARVSKDTDATYFVGQHTCTPARRFAMKSVLVKPTEK